MTGRWLPWFAGYAVLAAAFSGCGGPKPFLLDGDANSAQVGFYGDPAPATAVAKLHCARYERVPRYVRTAEDVAYFDCVKP
jgi:hypothetical protein